MSVFLKTVAALAFLAPILFWGYLTLLACGFLTSSIACGLGVTDYWDAEFLTLAALPWLVAAACLMAVFLRR